MSPTTLEVVDSLSLLALKVASNVFDLSSRMHHVSIRDQIVRGQMAVRDLKRGDAQLASLLIVGAGVAGMSAALTAAELGVSNVVVVEIADQPFALLRGVTARYVGPFMYEWPSHFCADQSYPDNGRSEWSGHASSPLSWLSKDPCSADQLATMLTGALTASMASRSTRGLAVPTICVNENESRIQNYVGEFARTEAARAQSRLQGRAPRAPAEFGYYNSTTWPSGNPARATFIPDYIFLAAGMGEEKLDLVAGDKSCTGSKFWANDDLLDAATANRKVAIFGGGDGALQDVLRALTGEAQPLELIRYFEASPYLKRALRRVTPDLLSADRQGRQFATWNRSGGEYKSVDEFCKCTAADMARHPRVVDVVGETLRKGGGEVSLFLQNEHYDKAYLLNRFLVHLIEACASHHVSTWSGRVGFSVWRQHQAIGCRTTGGRRFVRVEQVQSKKAFELEADRIVVRYGIGLAPGAQMIQVSQQESKQRTTLSRVELPFVPGPHPC